MTTFKYEALNSAGKAVCGTVDAVTTEEAIQRIKAQGYYPTRVREKQSEETETVIESIPMFAGQTKTGLSDRTLANICHGGALLCAALGGIILMKYTMLAFSLWFIGALVEAASIACHTRASRVDPGEFSERNWSAKDERNWRSRE